MVNRLEFFDSISGIKYPRMIIDFFDHFIALKQLVEDSGSISVDESTENCIRFSIIFNSPDNKTSAMSNILAGEVIIYGRLIHISFMDISETELKIELR